MSQFSLVSKSNEKGEQFLFKWRNSEFFSLNSWANVESLAEHLNIKLTLFLSQLKLIEIGLLDLDDCELELMHVDFWYISRDKEGLVESSVLDDVKDNLVSLFLLSHSAINPHVCGTDLDSVSFRNPCLFKSSLLNFLLTHDSA
ncbi:hypothetical protein Tco_0323105 [Tanacetum coccineum]